jgi:hypothetical protein
MKENIIAAVAIIALVVSGWTYFVMPPSLIGNGTFGATTATGMLAENYIPYVLYNGGYNSAKDINTSAYLGSTGTFQVGSNGTTFSNIKAAGTCAMIFDTGYTSVFNASSTRAVDCAVTGLLSTDTVIVAMLGTTTISSTNSNGWQISQASASSTNGFLTMNVTYWGAGTATIPPSIASTTAYLIVR